MADHSVILAAEPGIRLIGIGNDFGWLSALSGTEIFGFIADGSFTDALCRFDQQTAQVCIPCFGYASLFTFDELECSPGARPRNAA